MSSTKCYDTTTIHTANLTLRGITHTDTPPGGKEFTFHRRQITPEGFPDDKTFPLCGIHIPPVTGSTMPTFCPVGYPVALRDSIQCAIQAVREPIELNDWFLHPNGVLWWKCTEVKQAQATSSQGDVHDIALTGYKRRGETEDTPRGVMGVGHLSVYLLGKTRVNSIQVIPSSWTLHIDIHIIHVTSWTLEIPRFPQEIAHQDFIAELLQATTLSSTR